MSVRAAVRNGRLIVDQPTDLPEGTVLDLVVDDEGDQLDDEERQALNAAISRSLAQADEGRTAERDDHVLVVAVWGAVKASGPDLTDLGS